MSSVSPLEKIDDSLLFKRLTQLASEGTDAQKTERTALVANVRHVVREARFISATIVRYMPQYTYHNEVHLFNVLAIMEHLIPEAVLLLLSPLECALCILTAFTHDLGMALSESEYKKLHEGDTEERQAFLRYRDRYSEELRQIARLKAGVQERRNELQNPSNATKAAQLEKEILGIEEGYKAIEGFLLTDYLRHTHALDGTNRRILYWLGELEKNAGNTNLFKYGNYSFKYDLVNIGISHNQPTYWLRQKYTGNDVNNPSARSRFGKPVGSGEFVNFAFPGLLLRLADVMDFDASRAPSILFRHIGIENKISLREWKKHMAITGWSFDTTSPHKELLYSAASCEHPALEKTIRDFVDYIRSEVRNTADELRLQNADISNHKRDKYAIHLPDVVRVDVEPQRDDDGIPRYEYREMQFRLDQDEILQLLMGENLYGDPSLCIRELLQNALDAVQMRDLRLKQDRTTRIEPTDEWAKDEEPHVCLSWGKDDSSGQEYIRVTDNGIGMTRRVLESFFTQIGKSYYRSPDFKREETLMRAKGFYATPISQFGIGMLSCFMIGDRLEVRTCPGGADANERKPYDVTISGPGSLFWLRPGTRMTQGTEVILYLKSGFQLSHDASTLLKRLRINFGHEEEYLSYFEEVENFPQSDKKILIDPAFIAGQHIVWPQYPLLMQPDLQKKDVPTLTINSKFYWEKLFPPPLKKMRRIAERWGCPAEKLGNSQWSYFDWTDTDTDNATGSRIRIVYYTPSPLTNSLDRSAKQSYCTTDEGAAFIEGTTNNRVRDTVLIKGIYVPDTSKIEELLPIGNGVGTYLWIDLRGKVTPHITADRRRAMVGDDDWKQALNEMFLRWSMALQTKVDNGPESLCIWRYLVHTKNNLRPTAVFSYKSELNIVSRLICSWHTTNDLSSAIRFRILQLTDELTIARDRHYSLNLNRVFADTEPLLHIQRVHDIARDIDLAFTLGRANDYIENAALKRDNNIANDRDIALTVALNLDFDINIDEDIDQYLDKNLDSTIERDLDKLKGFKNSLYSYFLTEALTPSFQDSFPLFDSFTLNGNIGDTSLVGPGIINIDLDQDGQHTSFSNPADSHPEVLTQNGYDIAFPLTNVPIGHLRKECPEWRINRAYRAMGILPFLYLGRTEIWSEHSSTFQSYLNVERIYAFIPLTVLWDKKFTQWNEEDWNNGVLSALWHIPTGRVLWALGTHPVAEMETIGNPFEELFPPVS